MTGLTHSWFGGSRLPAEVGAQLWLLEEAQNAGSLRAGSTLEEGLSHQH